MKFTVSSSNLLSHIQTVSRVIASKNTLPILDDILFNVDGTRLELTASDLETTLVTELQLESGEGTGKVAIPAKLPIDMLREFSEQPLTFDINDDTFGVTISSEAGTYSLVGVNGNEYPALPTFNENVNALTIPVETLETSIATTIFATTEDNLRPVMTGINFDITEENVTMVATDAHKLVRYRALNVRGEKPASFILPKKAATALLNVLAKESGDAVVQFDEKSAVFNLVNYKMFCRQIEGRFPNYNSVIPANNPNKLIVDRQALMGVVRRVSIFANEASNLIKLQISPNEMVISAQDIDFQQSGQERLSCQYQGDPMSIGFQSSYLLEILKNIDSEQVVFELADPSRAGIILPFEGKEGEDLLMLLMPMLLND